MLYRKLCGLLLCFVLSAAALPVNATEATYANPQLLTTVSQLAALSETSPVNGRVAFGPDVVVLDVRPLADFAKGQIPGARHLDPDEVTDPDAPVAGALRPEAAIAGLIGDLGISARTRVVLYDDKGGFHAARVFWLLEYFGHRQVSLLDGGLQTWIDQGHVLDTRPVPVRTARRTAGRFTPALTPRRHASADWILARRDDPETVVIDVRPAGAFAKGHIPWARNIPWKQNLAADGRMKSAEALGAHFEAQGVTPAANIVVHCQNGKASAHSYFALRLLGYPRVRTYHRSWSEWGTAEELPKASLSEG